MKEILEIYNGTPIILIFLVVIAYFSKIFVEKIVEGFAARLEKDRERLASKAEKDRERLASLAEKDRERLADRIENVAKISLDMKKDLRFEERGELVAFRVALEKWDNFLQTLLFDFSMLSSSQVDIKTVYENDKNLFLEVKIGVVKVGIYLRNEELELKLMAAIIKLRKTCYPIINESLLKLIDLQARLIPIENKLKQFELSGMKDMLFAPTQEDRETHLALQSQITEELARFSNNFQSEYLGIAEQMQELKEDINKYIYRPINQTAVDKD